MGGQPRKRTNELSLAAFIALLEHIEPLSKNLAAAGDLKVVFLAWRLVVRLKGFGVWLQQAPSPRHEHLQRASVHMCRYETERHSQ